METIEIDYAKILQDAQHKDALSPDDREKITLWANAESFLVRSVQYPELKKAHETIWAEGASTTGVAETKASSGSSIDITTEIPQKQRDEIAQSLIASLYTMQDFKKEYTEIPLSDESKKFLKKTSRISPGQRKLESLAALLAIDLIDSEKPISEVRKNFEQQQHIFEEDIGNQVLKDLQREHFLISIDGVETAVEGDIFNEPKHEKIRSEIQQRLTKEQFSYLSKSIEQGSTKQAGCEAYTTSNLDYGFRGIDSYTKIIIAKEEASLEVTQKFQLIDRDDPESDVSMSHIHSFALDISKLSSDQEYRPGFGSSPLTPKLTIISELPQFMDTAPSSARREVKDEKHASIVLDNFSTFPPITDFHKLPFDKLYPDTIDQKLGEYFKFRAQDNSQIDKHEFFDTIEMIEKQHTLLTEDQAKELAKKHFFKTISIDDLDDHKAEKVSVLLEITKINVGTDYHKIHGSIVEWAEIQKPDNSTMYTIVNEAEKTFGLDKQQVANLAFNSLSISGKNENPHEELKRFLNDKAKKDKWKHTEIEAAYQYATGEEMHVKPLARVGRALRSLLQKSPKPEFQAASEGKIEIMEAGKTSPTSSSASSSPILGVEETKLGSTEPSSPQVFPSHKPVNTFSSNPKKGGMGK